VRPRLKKSSHQQKREKLFFFPSDFQLLAVVTCIFMNEIRTNSQKIAQVSFLCHQHNLSHTHNSRPTSEITSTAASRNQSHIFLSRGGCIMERRVRAPRPVFVYTGHIAQNNNSMRASMSVSLSLSQRRARKRIQKKENRAV
jgi:hypothetical protein